MAIIDIHNKLSDIFSELFCDYYPLDVTDNTIGFVVLDYAPVTNEYPPLKELGLHIDTAPTIRDIDGIETNTYNITKA